MSHVIEDYVTTCHMSRHNQLKLLLMKLYYCWFTNAKIPNYKSAIPTMISTISITFTYFPHIYCIKKNERVCILKRYLCHDIKKPMSYHIMEFCHDMSYVTTIMASLVCKGFSYYLTKSRLYGKSWPHALVGGKNPRYLFNPYYITNRMK